MAANGSNASIAAHVAANPCGPVRLRVADAYSEAEPLQM